ncbi:hypothetical protein TRFO_22370 [Tritrichomonas foetus]|uniref:Uncharacterized protein n=1 Tax=Tritrichomonas foetus TaxID=1144522 RepID=A0A1J4KDF2_9EUKA|nr:hypothetical protein TRFO_22370 [Tritrichomonas foetus]|eukprot:OHT08944.1 hypothetical protein TRFO_22370 [Tritrichomonas foetus]
MDDSSSSGEFQERSNHKIRNIIDKINAIENFETANKEYFANLRQEIVQLPNYSIEIVTAQSSIALSNVVTKCIQELMKAEQDIKSNIDFSSKRSKLSNLLENIFSLMFLLNFNVKNCGENSKSILQTFSMFLSKCEINFKTTIIRLFSNMLDEKDPLFEQNRQLFFHFFLPPIFESLSKFLPFTSNFINNNINSNINNNFVDNNNEENNIHHLHVNNQRNNFENGENWKLLKKLNLYKISFILDVISTFNFINSTIYHENQKILNQINSIFFEFLHFQVENPSKIEEIANVTLIQSKIIKVFINFYKMKIPVRNNPFGMTITYLIEILQRVNPSYFYPIRDIIYSMILMMKNIPENKDNFRKLLDNLPLFCKYSNYNQSLIDPYTILIQLMIEKSQKLNIINNNDRLILFNHIINLLHYQKVPSFLRHNEFMVLQNYIPIKSIILYLYAFSIDVDILNFTFKISKYLNREYNNDIDTLLVTYNNVYNIGKYFLQIFKLYKTNLNSMFEYYKMNTSSLLYEITSRYDVFNTNIIMSTLLDSFLFVIQFLRLFDILSTITPPISPTNNFVNNNFNLNSNIVKFYEMENKMLQISKISDNNAQTNELISELIEAFSMIPMNFAEHIFDIYFENYFLNQNFKLNKLIISSFSQKPTTIMPFLDSYFSFIIPKIQYNKDINMILSETMNTFTLLNEIPLDFKISTFYQQILQNKTQLFLNIMKDDFVPSTKFGSIALELISNVARFIDKLFGNLSLNSIINAVFIKEICQSILIIPMQSKVKVEFIQFCISISEDYLKLPYILEILIESLNKEPDSVIPLLNQATKLNKKAVYQHQMSLTLFQTSASLLNTSLSNSNKKILLKFLKHSTSISIGQLERVPLDIFNLKKIFFRNSKSKVEFRFSLNDFISTLEQTINESPNNQILFDIVGSTIESLLQSNDFSLENRKTIIYLMNFVFSFYEKVPIVVKKCILQILTKSEGSVLTYAHVFASICSVFENPPSEFICIIFTIIRTINDFKSMIHELHIISYFNLLSSKNVIDTIAITIIENAQSDVIDPIEFALFIHKYLISSDVFDINNEYRSDNLTTFSELEYLPKKQIDIILFIRDLLSTRPSSLAPLLRLAPSLKVFPQIILFEFMSKCEFDQEVLFFFDQYISDTSLEASNHARLIGLCLRAFPGVVKIKGDKINEIIKNLYSNYLDKPCGDLLPILNAVINVDCQLLLNNIVNYFSCFLNFIFSNNIFFRHQARTGLFNLYNIRNPEIEPMITKSFTDYCQRVNFPNFINDSTFIDFSVCYEFLMIYYSIYPDTIFSTIIHYLDHIESHYNRQELQKVSQDIFVRSFLSFFSFLSNGSVIKLLIEKGFLISLMTNIAFIYNTFIFPRNRILDSYIIKMLKIAPSQFIEYFNTIPLSENSINSSMNSQTSSQSNLLMNEQMDESSTEIDSNDFYSPFKSSSFKCINFFVIFLENKEALDLLKPYKADIKLFNQPFELNQSSENYLEKAILFSYFDENIEMVYDSLITHIKLFHSNIKNFNSYLFKKLISFLLKKDPKYFLQIVFFIIKNELPLLLSHCRIIFKENLNCLSKEIFTEIEYPTDCKVIELFFEYFVTYYIKINHDSVQFIIDYVQNNQSPYLFASFMSHLIHKKIISPNLQSIKLQENEVYSKIVCSVDAFDLYEKCQDDESRLKTLDFWSKNPNSQNCEKMMSNLEKFITLYCPIEVYKCLYDLVLPKNQFLPLTYFENFPLYYKQEAAYSSLLSLVVRNPEQISIMPQNLIEDLMMILEYSFFSNPNSFSDFIPLFEEIFAMIKDVSQSSNPHNDRNTKMNNDINSDWNRDDRSELNNMILIHRCESYISKLLNCIKISTRPSRTYTNLALKNAFKIIHILGEETPLIDEVAAFYQYMLERCNMPHVYQVLLLYLPNLVKMYVDKNDIKSTEVIISSLVDMNNHDVWPYVMISLSLLCEFDEIYERVCNFRSPSLIERTFPIIWTSPKEKTLKQVQSTIKFCSKKQSSRVDVLLQDFTMNTMINNLQEIASLCLLNKLCKKKNPDFIARLLKFGLKSSNDYFSQFLFQYLQDKDILNIFLTKNKNSSSENSNMKNDKIDNEIYKGLISKIPLSTLVHVIHHLPTEYLQEVNNTIYSISNNLSQQNNSLANETGKIDEFYPILYYGKIFADLFEGNACDTIPFLLKFNSNFFVQKFEENNSNDEFSPTIYIKSKLSCLKNLSFWDESKIKLNIDFADSQGEILPSPVLLFRHSQKFRAQESLTTHLNDLDLFEKEVSEILMRNDFIQILDFISDNFIERDSIIEDLNDYIDQIFNRTTQKNYLDYIILHSMKKPLESLKKSGIGPNEIFNIKISTTVDPETHIKYTKIRETFLSIYSKLSDSNLNSSSNTIFHQLSSENNNDERLNTEKAFSKLQLEKENSQKLHININNNNKFNQKTYQNYIKKYNSIHEMHKNVEKITIANFTGKEVKYNTPEKDLEKMVAAVFLNSILDEKDGVYEGAVNSLKYGLKMNQSNDVFLAVISSKYEELSAELDTILNMVKNIPFRWSPLFVEYIVEEERIFGSLIPKINRAFYINLVEGGACVDSNIKKLVNRFVQPLYEIIKSQRFELIRNNSLDENKLIQIIRKKPSNIKNFQKQKENPNDFDNSNSQDNINNDYTMLNQSNNRNYLNEINFEDSSFVNSCYLPPFPAPLSEENSSTLHMSCYLDRKDDQYITIKILLTNGHFVNYIMTPTFIDQRVSLFNSIVNSIILGDPLCSKRNQMIESLKSAKLIDDFTLINTNGGVPLYRASILKKLIDGAKELGPKATPSQKCTFIEDSQTSLNWSIENYNKRIYNFSQKESYIKWFWHFGSRYAALSTINSCLMTPTPSPKEIFINHQSACISITTIDEIGSNYSSIRMCGKLKNFFSNWILYGPFRQGIISMASCFAANRYKITLLLDSIYGTDANESLTFIRKSTNMSIHHTQTNRLQKNVNDLISNSFNDNRAYIIPWL